MYNQGQYNPNAGAALAYQGGGGVSGSAQITPNDAPETPTQIRNNLGDAEQLISGIHSAIDLVEKRFDTVLLPVGPAVTSTAGNTPTPQGSHVRGRVLLLNEAMAAAIQRLQALLTRADV